jgi:selenide, water dikinase
MKDELEMEKTQEKIRLTQYSKGAGCGCKIAPKDLQEILSDSYTNAAIKNLIVGNNTHDDAAVYNLGNDQYLISTTDFFTPIVDDAFDFGRIASANAVSDVYAMGGKPILAIAILGWPVGKLPNDLAKEVLRGASVICNEVGIPLAGGHSIDSPEPFFGLSVNGIVSSTSLKKNDSAKENDIIYITKPIGTGILSTAQKRGLLSPENYTGLVNQLVRVNRSGIFFSQFPEVTSMTDVTGFGIIGHLLEICKGSKLSAELINEKIPLMDGVSDLVKQFVYPDNMMRNYQAFLPYVEGLSAGNMFSLCDPQTNGGLMLTVAKSFKQAFEKLCSENNVTVIEIGQMKKIDSKSIYIS